MGKSVPSLRFSSLISSFNSSKSRLTRRQITKMSKLRSSQGGKRSRRQVEESEESEGLSDHEVTSATQVTEVEKLANSLVRLALVNEYSRKPLKRETIIKHVIPNNPKIFKQVLMAANNKLVSTFGMELVQLPNRATDYQDSNQAVQTQTNTQAPTQQTQAQTQTQTQTQTQASKKKLGPTNLFVLRSCLDQKLLRRLAHIEMTEDEDENNEGGNNDENDGGPSGVEGAEWREWSRDNGVDVFSAKNDQRALSGILHVILSLILINGRSITEPELYQRLHSLGLNNNTVLPLDMSAPRRDSVTVNVFIRQLCAQYYLFRKVPNRRGGTQLPAATQTQAQEGPELGDPNVEYVWGPRAHVEIGEKLIMDQFITRILIPNSRQGEDRKVATQRVVKGVSRAAGGDILDAKALKSVEDAQTSSTRS